MELPKRKSTRLKGYDYGTPGAYFVTICTHNRKCILGNIVGEGLCALPQNQLTRIVGEGLRALPQNQLTRIVGEGLRALPQKQLGI